MGYKKGRQKLVHTKICRTLLGSTESRTLRPVRSSMGEYRQISSSA